MTLRAKGPWPVPELALAGTILFAVPVLVFAFDALMNPVKLDAVPTTTRIQLGCCVLASGFMKWLHARMKRSSWHAEIFEMGVELKSSPRAPTRVWAPWSDILWFDDSEQENVRVKLKGPVSGLIDIYLATPSEADRTALLGILAAKVVRRQE